MSRSPRPFGSPSRASASRRATETRTSARAEPNDSSSLISGSPLSRTGTAATRGSDNSTGPVLLGSADPGADRAFVSVIPATMRPRCRSCVVRLSRACHRLLAAGAMAEDAIQGKDKVVTGPQCVRQNGLGRAGLAEHGGHDQGPVPARLVPGRYENTSAGGLRAAGLETGDPVLAQQRVVVTDQAG